MIFVVWVYHLEDSPLFLVVYFCCIDSGLESLVVLHWFEMLRYQLSFINGTSFNRKGLFGLPKIEQKAQAHRNIIAFVLRL